MLEWYGQLKQLANNNPVFAGVLSLYGLTVVTYLLREVPAKLKETIVRHCTTQLFFNNTGWGSGPEYFRTFSIWAASGECKTFSRTFSVTAGNNQNRPALGPGYGTHFFIFKGRLFWFTKSKIDSAGSENQKEEIVIATLGRNKKAFNELLKKFDPTKTKEGYLKILGYRNEWITQTSVRKRPIESVFINPESKTRLMSALDSFFTNRQEYIRKGLTHKLTCVLYGEPGTGKTSLVRAIASQYDLDIHVIRIESMTDNSFEDSIRTVPERSLILVEDFDSNSAFHERGNNGGPVLSSDGYPTLTINSILNTLDGIVNLDNTLTFLTTNHIDKIDPAILRKGRTDLLIEVGKLEPQQVQDFIAYHYPEMDIPKVEQLKPMLGCELQDLLRVHLDNGSSFVSDLLLLSEKQNT